MLLMRPSLIARAKLRVRCHGAPGTPTCDLATLDQAIQGVLLEVTVARPASTERVCAGENKAAQQCKYQVKAHAATGDRRRLHNGPSAGKGRHRLRGGATVRD